MVDARALGARGGRSGLPRDQGGRSGCGRPYGFLLCFVFTLATYGGAAPAITRVPFFTVLGLVGALCGLLLALLGTSSCRGDACHWNHRSGMMPPNKRLKLPGAPVLKEAVVSCPDGHGTFVHHPCAGGRIARSLSAIR